MSTISKLGADMTDELLPCPFCGEEEPDLYFVTGTDFCWKVKCRECGASRVDASLGKGSQDMRCRARAIEKWNRRALLARQPAAIDKDAAGYTEQFDVDELKRGGVMRVFAAHETDQDIPVYLTTPLEKESNQPVEPKVTITRQQFDAMRVALEVIAVGDSKTPSDTAAHGLVASGFWTDALETENSNSRAASTSANVAQGSDAQSVEPCVKCGHTGASSKANAASGWNQCGLCGRLQ